MYRYKYMNPLDNALAMHSGRNANASAAEVELDLGRYELRRSGRRVKLEKKPMELLILLAARREQLVSRE
jgi:DNA-binding winged helix-turn-helix (wHTH) protein